MDESTKPSGEDASRGGTLLSWLSPRGRAGRLGLEVATVVLVAITLYGGGRLVQREYGREQAKWAGLVNASGQQRIRSQRIALLALQLVRADSDTAADRIREQLLGAVERTDRVARRLGDPSSGLNPSGMPSEKVERLYRAPPHELDRRLTAYLDAARRLTDAPPDRRTMDNVSFRHILESAPGLLVSLDRAVSAYEEASRASLRTFEDRSLLALIAVVVFALSLGLFWIQPKITALRRRADERARELFAAAPVGLVLIDEAGWIVEVNRQIEEMFDHRSGELIGSPADDLLPEITTDGWDSVLADVHLESKDDATSVSGMELEGRRKDGSSFPAFCVLRPLEMEDAPHVRRILEGGVDLSIRVHTDEVEDRLGPDEKVACYRIVQEAVANAIAHARASNLTVVIEAAESRGIRIVVEDDGRGFEPDRVTAGNGTLGVLSMRERASVAGGPSSSRASRAREPASR